MKNRCLVLTLCRNETLSLDRPGGFLFRHSHRKVVLHHHSTLSSRLRSPMRTWFRRIIHLLFLLPLLLYSSQVMAQGLGRGTAARPVDEWPLADPDTMGLNREALAAHIDLCRDSGASGCLVACRGYIVQQWYDASYAPFIGTRSAVKSWTGLLAGMIIADGKIKSIDDPVSDYIPEWKAGSEAGVTIRHLLTMTAGLRNRTQDQDNHPGVVGTRNTTGFVFSLPLDWQPGEKWAYSNESVQLLSPILERAAGIPLSQYARERLFDPLAMDSTHFHVDEYYNTVTFGGAETTLHDFARIGQLMLNEGRWNGKQIVPAEWVRQSTQPIPQKQNYGYLWWIDPPRNNFAATGTFDNNCIVFPDLDMVVARLQRDPRPDARVPYQSVRTLELLRSIVEGEPSRAARESASETPRTSAVPYSGTWPGFEHLYEQVQQMPMPEGGIQNLMRQMAAALAQHQPCPNKQRAIVAFVVDTNGDVAATRLHEGAADVCTEALERAVHQIKFSPGLHQGEPVNVVLMLPVTTGQ